MLFQSHKNRDDFLKSQRITVEEAVEIAARLWTQQRQDIASLQTELNELRKLRRVAWIV